MDKDASHLRVDEAASGAGTGSEPTVKLRRYVLISPCRDEANYMRETLDTVISQSI